jgi:hypothetical protein
MGSVHETPRIAFDSARAFNDWLAQNHDRESGILVSGFRASVCSITMSYDQMLDVALSWGWVPRPSRDLESGQTLLWFEPFNYKDALSDGHRSRLQGLQAAGRLRLPALKLLDY